jgi:hypothetical protein
MFEVVITMVIGRSREISTSKFRKITAMRKNRNENGNRVDFLGRNRIQMVIFFHGLQYFSLIVVMLKLLWLLLVLGLLLQALVVTIIT